MTLTNVSVIGLGCIGGSVVKSLAGDVARVRGWSASSEDRAMARASGHDVPEAIESALVDADIIVIAVPVQAMVEVMHVVLGEARADATILHCGGVQSRQALALDDATFARVRGTHPLAGSQDSGFAAARADLFEGCTVSVERPMAPAQETHARWLWGELGAARQEFRTAEEHECAHGLDQPAAAARVDRARGNVCGGAHRSAKRGTGRSWHDAPRRECVRAVGRTTSGAARGARCRSLTPRDDGGEHSPCARAGRSESIAAALGFGARVASRGRAVRVTAPLEIRVPGDKSLSHRALIFSALATGRSRVRDILQSADVHSTAGVLRALGVAVPSLADDIAIDAGGASAMRRRQSASTAETAARPRVSWPALPRGAPFARASSATRA